MVSGTVFLRDTFTDVNNTPLENHTPEVGGAWVNFGFAGFGQIINNQYTRIFPISAGHYNDTPSLSGNYDVEVVVAQMLSSASSGVSGKWIDLSNGYVWHYEGATATQTLVRTVGAVNAVLATLVEAVPAAPFVLRFECRTTSPRLRVLIDGVEKLTSDDATFTGVGKVALNSTGGSPANNTIFEEVMAQDALTSRPLAVVGEYRPAIALVGEYRPAIALVGDYRPAVPIEGVYERT